ncbi:MAG: lipopolysaccharide kinase InaA family protein [Planctomycetota bacterium]
MKTWTRSTREGRAVVRTDEAIASPDAFVDACLEFETRRSGERRRVGGIDVVLKAGPLARSGARRHGLRRLALGAPAPAEAEFHNLRWLQQRLFRVPRPVAAVTVLVGGLPTRQLLATEAVHGAENAAHAWRVADGRTTAAWSRELGRELGRMHALRFLHGDLYPRNVLVGAPAADGSPGHGRSLVWLDAWSGGPTAWRRGSLRRVEQDLGAWFSSAADWMSAEEQSTVLEEYVAARAANRRPGPEVRRLVARIQRARRVELARLERDRGRLRGEPFPVAGWDPPAGAVELRASSRSR